MPRRPAKVTQADIARAIRAAKEAGASAVTVDGGGVIRIALTASAMQGDRERALAAGFTGYLAKPVALVHLREEVQRLLQTGSDGTDSPAS